MRPTAVALALALLLIASLTGPVFGDPLRVGTVPTPHCALIYLADSQGLFKKHGIDVSIKMYEAGPLAVQELVAGKVDIATAAESVFVQQAFRHPDLRMPATICTGSDEDLVVRADRGIKTPQDLKGKRVAVTRGSSAEFFFHNYLIFNHIPPGSVRIVYQTPSEMVRAMADGTVDAALSWQPFTSQMSKQLGTKAGRWPAQSGQDYYFTLLTKEGFVKKQPKAIERFLAALSDAEEFAAKYPGRAQELLRQRLGVETISVLEMWSRARFEIRLTQDMLVLMEREAKWAMRNNLVESKEMPNYLDFLYFDALDKVKPEAVSIVH